MIIRASADFTRPSNVTAYSGGDVIGPASGQGLIPIAVPFAKVNVVGALVESNATQDPGGGLWIVSSSSFAPGLDNAALTYPGLSDGFCGLIFLEALPAGNALVGTPATSTYIKLNSPVNVVGNTIYAALMAGTGFTPASGQQFRITLHCDVPALEARF